MRNCLDEIDPRVSLRGCLDYIDFCGGWWFIVGGNISHFLGMGLDLCKYREGTETGTHMFDVLCS